MAGIAQSDVGIELWSSATGSAASYQKLIEVVSVPATGSAPGKLEATELSSATKQYIGDRPDIPDMEYTYNYTDTNFAAVQAICGALHYFLVIYQDGSGVVTYGTAATWIDAVGRGSVVQAKMSVVAQSVEYEDDTSVTALKAGS